MDIEFDYDRNFCLWLVENNCSIMASSYSKQKVFSVGTKDDGTLSIYYTNMGRPMGLCRKDSTLYLASIGNIIRYENKGPEEDDQFGKFDAAFYPQSAFLAGDIDCHDLRMNDAGEVFYISTLFNCVCQPSLTKSFEPFFIPPWITTNENGDPPGEDRCHLNGLCLGENGKPRYLTAVCNKDYHMAWRDHMQKGGIVYDIQNDEIVASGVSCPHSPQLHNGKLWVLEAGTGYLGYVDLEKKEFVQKKFLPGFLRGLSFIGKYAVVCLSSDRHDNSFKDNQLGKTLEEKEQKSRVGIFIIDTETFDTKHQIQFNGEKVEFYDVLVVPGIRRPRVYDITDSKLIEKFHLR